MVRSILAALAFVGISLLAFRGPEPAAAAQASRSLSLPVRPDVVLMVIDDVADSDIDAIQAKGWCTNLTELANDGIRYRRAYAHAKCSPTRDSLTWSRWLGQDHLDSCAAPVPGVTHTLLDYSLPELFDGAGYRTLHVGKWHVGPNYVGDWKVTAELTGYDSVRATVPIGDSCGGVGSNRPRLDDGAFSLFNADHTMVFRDELLAWWAATPPPRFAVVEFSAAHEPFSYPDQSLLPPGYPTCGLVNCTNRKKYEAMIVGVDTAVGQIRAAIGPSAYYVFAGDNGTPGIVPGQNPAQTVATRANQDPSRVKLTCYEDGVRVPLIVAGPLIQPGVSTSLVHVVDLLPTLAQIASLKPDPAALVHGRSFAATLVGLPGPRQYVFCWNPPPRNDRALIETRWKLLTRDDGVEELYDLQNDPLELVPLPPVGPDADRLRAERDSVLAGNP